MNFKLVIGIIMLAIVIFVFPLVLDGTAAILADANLADYTGLESVVGFTPLLIWLSVLISGGLLTYSGIKSSRSGGKSRSRR